MKLAFGVETRQVLWEALVVLQMIAVLVEFVKVDLNQGSLTGVPHVPHKHLALHLLDLLTL